MNYLLINETQQSESESLLCPTSETNELRRKISFLINQKLSQIINTQLPDLQNASLAQEMLIQKMNKNFENVSQQLSENITSIDSNIEKLNNLLPIESVSNPEILEIINLIRKTTSSCLSQVKNLNQHSKDTYYNLSEYKLIKEVSASTEK